MIAYFCRATPPSRTNFLLCHVAASSTSSQSSSSSSSSSFLKDLSLITSVSTNPYALSSHSKGESFHPPRPPSYVANVSSLAEVQGVVKLCSSHNTPLVPFGAGTSLEGHVSCLRQGSVSLSTMESFNGLLSVDEESMSCVVEPGITRHSLNSHLRATGLHFPVDPGADATLGGMAATNASGTSAVKYGTMKENVLGMEVVTADGEVCRVGCGAKKNSAGYDLKNLFVGSEGTLGVITSLTLKLHPLPANVSSGVSRFPSLLSAADAVLNLLACGVPVAKCEILDGSAIDAFNKYSPEVDDMPISPHLFVELQDCTSEGLEAQEGLVTSILSEAGADDGSTSFSSDPSKSKKLWAARHATYYASCALRPDAKGLVTDACVPLSALAGVIRATAEDVAESGVVGPVFGHAGDGNFHCILPLREDDDEEYVRRVEGLNERLIKRTLEAGGTCTGEHGVGSGKVGYLEEQYGAATVEVMRTIKRSLDPKNILNPDKVLTL